MLTFQDFQKADDKKDFIRQFINYHKSTNLYQTAVVADEYDRHQNRTIRLFQKLLYDVSGNAVPDNWSPNFKMASKFFNRFITQENQYLLGNGVSWKNSATKAKLGDNFDTQLQKAGKKALCGAVSFGFWNMDHLDVFPVTEFAPMYDEENGALMAGVRFWQIDSKKPLRATLYEIDGYTEYKWDSDNPNGVELVPKRNYMLKTRTSEADGTEIYDGENYPGFPIVPLWGNSAKQSALVGLREQIDCYDLIKSGYANTVDEGSLIYWTLNNAGGMDNVDLAQFVQKMRMLHATTTDNNVKAESHTLEVPYESREALLNKLRNDLYEDAMALDTKNIANGAATATQIRAAYEPLNSKTDEFEYCVNEFLKEILRIAGIDDEPTFTRSVIVNSQEELQLVIQSAQFLPDEYITKKVLTLLGDGDMADDILKAMAAEEIDRDLQEENEEDEAGAEEEQE